MPRFETDDGVELVYTDAGAGAPVVFVAGYTAPRQSWLLNHDAVLASGRRSVLFDRRSTGESGTTSWGQRIARHGRDLGELLDHLGGGPVTLVGSSMGASTIWSYLDLFGPGRVRAVVSVDQTPRMINGPEWPYGFYGLDAGNSGTFFAEGIPATGRGLPPEGSLPGLTRLTERAGTLPPPRDAASPCTLRLLDDHAHQDWRDVAARCAVPFLMVAGAESQLWSPEHAAATAALNPLGRTAVVAGAGHLTHVDQSDAFDALLLGFLDEVGG